MIESLFIKNFVLVKELSLELDTNLSIFTGETGAGKSIIMDALALLLGKRATTIKIREGCETAEISAFFHIVKRDAQEELKNWLVDNGFPAASDEILIKRILGKNGKSKTWINGAPCLLSQTKELGEILVEIHSQNAHQRLLSKDYQRKILDDFAKLNETISLAKKSWDDWQKSLEGLQMLKQNSLHLNQKREMLTWKINEIKELNLKLNEWENISTQHAKLSKMGQILECTSNSLLTIQSSDRSIISLLEKLSTQLSCHKNDDKALEDACLLIDQSIIELKEAVSNLSKFEAKSDIEPANITQVESRLSEILNTAQKLKIKPEDIDEVLADSEKELLNLETKLEIDNLEKETTEKEKKFFSLAEIISAERKKASHFFSEKVCSWLGKLSMGQCIFEIEVSQNKNPGPFGIDDVQFKISQIKNSKTLPLSQTASGGELSRITLAITMVMSNSSKTPTVIFDEVDSGIGGNTANIVGELLSTLGSDQQILCITHLPQIAAKGKRQFLVEKSFMDNTLPTTRIKKLELSERITEIARMLGGEEAEKTSLDHARSLLQIK